MGDITPTERWTMSDVFGEVAISTAPRKKPPPGGAVLTFMRRLMTALVLVLVTGVFVVGALALRLGTGMGTEVAEGPSLSNGVMRVVVLGDSVARGAGDEQGLGLLGWVGPHP